MQKKLPSINLAHKRGSFIDRFINWALTLGRLIIMVTFLVGLSAFGYRLSLDWKLIDLKDKIKQKQAIVALLKEDEKKYRNLQERLTVITQLGGTAKATLDVVNDIIELTPADIVFDNFNLTGDRLHIDARARSVSSLASFVSSLRKHPSTQTLQVDKIENKTSTGTIIISITILVKKK